MSVTYDERLGAELGQSLLTGQGLSLVYMPTVVLSGGGVSGVEALVRWEHPSMGPVPTQEFVRLAEQQGLIAQLGDWVRREAFARAAVGGLPGRLAVNVSGLELCDAGFSDRLLAELSEHALDPRGICVEVTETALITDHHEVGESLARLRAAGVWVALDDFGTGHASLTYLATLPCDVVKIDRSFVASMAADRRSAAIVHSVIGMAGALDLTVVAEGVESSDQHEQLLEWGCGEGQGYWYGHAAPAAAIQSFDVAIPGQRPASPLRRSVVADAQLLVALTSALASATSVQQALDTVTATLRPVMACTGASIQLLGDDGIRMAAAYPPPTAEALAARLPEGQGVGGAVIASERVRYIPDIAALQAGVPARRRLTAASRDTRSYLAVPIVVHGSAIGLLQVDSVEVNAFSEADAVLLAGCAAALAASLPRLS